MRASSEHVEPVVEPEQAERTEADRHQQDHALEQRLPQRLEVEDDLYVREIVLSAARRIEE